MGVIFQFPLQPAEERHQLTKIGGTYEEMKEAFASVFEVSTYDTFEELFSLRMCETVLRQPFQGPAPAEC